MNNANHPQSPGPKEMKQQGKGLGSRFKRALKKLKRRNSSTSCSGNSVAKSVDASAHSKRPAPKENAQSPSLHIVLLLMDPTTKRFELLQLEFDSSRARVSDVLSQVGIAATEPTIRQQRYDGLLDKTGELMPAGVRLVKFCSERTVLVALPQGHAIKESLRFSRSILSDPKVQKMIEDIDFDTVGWRKEGDTLEDQPVEKSVHWKEDSKKGSFCRLGLSWIAILAIFVILCQVAHDYLSSPIQVGVPLAPGTWRSKCGLLGLFPKLLMEDHPCTNSFMSVNDDGTVSVYGDDQEPQMLLVGDACVDESCVAGVVMNESGMVYIGGKRVKTLTMYNEPTSFTPWPFEEEPRIKVTTFDTVA